MTHDDAIAELERRGLTGWRAALARVPCKRQSGGTLNGSAVQPSASRDGAAPRDAASRGGDRLRVPGRAERLDRAADAAQLEAELLPRDLRQAAAFESDIGREALDARVREEVARRGRPAATETLLELRLEAARARAAEAEFDPLWRLPLWTSYYRLFESSVADMNNAGDSGFAGSITAALFLKRFVERAKSHVHLDIFAWTPAALPARPRGGEQPAPRLSIGG